MKKLSTKRLVKLALVAAIYATLSLALSFITYGNIQFRIAEALILLCFYKKDYGISLTLGCLIVNLFSPMGFIDIIFGTIATAISVLLVCASPNIYLASLAPVICNALIIGFELWLVVGLPFAISALEVAFGEFVCVCLIGIPMCKLFERNSRFMRIIKE